MFSCRLYGEDAERGDWRRNLAWINSIMKDYPETRPVPKWPLVMITDRCIRRPILRETFRTVTQDELRKGEFKKDLRIIDVDCLRFPVLDALEMGQAMWPFWFLTRKRPHRIRFVYGEPTQLSFDEAREEICELVIRKRWHRYETREQFLARSNDCKTMDEFLESFSFFGRGAHPSKRKRRAAK